MNNCVDAVDDAAVVVNSRGALIVLEGCDRSGKTTQCKKLVSRLNTNGIKAQYLNFPDRSTNSGILIDAYLKNKQEFSNEVVHLLFSINRWEAKENMTKLLNDGITLVVDRYSYSGVAFSTAKGLDFKWCKEPETGLLKPDVVILLTMTVEAMTRRGGFGQERYEISELQLKANDVFMQLKDDDDNNDEYWHIIDGDKTESTLNDEIYQIIEKEIKNYDVGGIIGQRKLEMLW